MAKTPKKPDQVHKLPAYCAFDSWKPLDGLKPHPRNPNRHPDSQIQLLARVLTHQGWRSPIIVSNLSGFIVVGHGRWQAAQALGLAEAPVDFQDFKNDEDEFAHMIADNKLAELSELDEQVLQSIAKELGQESQAVTGFDEDELSVILSRTFITESEQRSFGNDVTDDVKKEKETYIVPVALTREQFRAWEKRKAELGIAGCKPAFLKLIGL